MKKNKDSKKRMREWLDYLSNHIKAFRKNKNYYFVNDTIFGFSSEAEDPINGMHEFTPSPLTLKLTKNAKCIHCGKTLKQLE